MSPEKWNALKPGDKVRRSHDLSVWEVTSTEPCMVTNAGYRQKCAMKLVSTMFLDAREGFFFEEFV